MCYLMITGKGFKGVVQRSTITEIITEIRQAVMLINYLTL